jgi:hypothetical protein
VSVLWKVADRDMPVPEMTPSNPAQDRGVTRPGRDLGDSCSPRASSEISTDALRGPAAPAYSGAARRLNAVRLLWLGLWLAFWLPIYALAVFGSVACGALERRLWSLSDVIYRVARVEAGKEALRG